MKTNYGRCACQVPDFKVEVDRIAQTVTVSGELDMATVPRLVQAASLVLEDTPDILTIDLRAVTFIDAGTIGALVGLQNEQASREGALTVMSNRLVTRIASLCGLSCLLEPRSMDCDIATLDQVKQP